MLVRTHAQTHLLAEALREAGIPHRVRGGAGVPRPARRAAALRDLRSRHRPLGTALADLELQLEDEAEPCRPRPLDELDPDDHDGRAEASTPSRGRARRAGRCSCAWAATTCASTPSAGPTASPPG